MRKLFSICICLTVLLTLLAGCEPGTTKPDTTQPSTEPITTTLAPTDPQMSQDPAIAALQQTVADAGCLLAVACLGGGDILYPDFAAYVESCGYQEDMPFLLDVPEENTVFLEGMELYALIPAPGVSLWVYECCMDTEGNSAAGQELLYTSGNEVLIIRGNVSDVIPSVLVVAEHQVGLKVEYSPRLSMENGQLVTREWVLDATNYDLVTQSPSLTDTVCCGGWYGTSEDIYGNAMLVNLELLPDGTAYYGYGAPYSEYIECFEGTWALDENNCISLSLYGGPIAYGEDDDVERYWMENTFTWDIQGGCLVICHETGMPLLEGKEQAFLSFLPFYGFHLIGTWNIEPTSPDTAYTLTLYENSRECALSVSQNGTVVASYEGFWSTDAAENTLELDLGRSSGQHPFYPDLTYISGIYQIEYGDTAGSLILSCIAGDLLMPEMEIHAVG